MVSALLLALGISLTAHDALRKFGEARTHDGKGVTIPSQARTVFYFEQWLARGLPRELWLVSPTYKITRVRFVTVPNFDVGVTGCDPYFLTSISNRRDLSYAQCWDMRDHVKKLPVSDLLRAGVVVNKDDHACHLHQSSTSKRSTASWTLTFQNTLFTCETTCA